MHGIKIEDTYPFTKAYKEKLRALGNYKVDGYLTVLESLNSQVTETSRKIRQTSEDNEAAKLLMTILGVGCYAGKTIICCAAGDPYTNRMSKAMEAFKVPVYETAERAVIPARALVLQGQVAGWI